ncbi:hypothetical protein GW17_00055764 [Ensete ventricosum]|nr:hypothetical protein GW17_00055764 [Ensete ventricosum]RZS15014.1 hypothetical protein BHM03_00046794 [Ensete ventricosum]
MAAQGFDTIIEHKAYARIGLLGNPSDVYFGRTISLSIGNFCATVRLEPSADLVIRPHPTHDLVSFSSIHHLVRFLFIISCLTSATLMYKDCRFGDLLDRYVPVYQHMIRRYIPVFRSGRKRGRKGRGDGGRRKKEEEEVVEDKEEEAVDKERKRRRGTLKHTWDVGAYLGSRRNVVAMVLAAVKQS